MQLHSVGGLARPDHQDCQDQGQGRARARERRRQQQHTAHSTTSGLGAAKSKVKVKAPLVPVCRRHRYWWLAGWARGRGWRPSSYMRYGSWRMASPLILRRLVLVPVALWSAWSTVWNHDGRPVDCRPRLRLRLGRHGLGGERGRCAMWYPAPEPERQFYHLARHQTQTRRSAVIIISRDRQTWRQAIYLQLQLPRANHGGRRSYDVRHVLRLRTHGAA